MKPATSLDRLGRLAATWVLAAAALMSPMRGLAQTPADALVQPRTAFSEHMQSLAVQFNAEAKDVPPIIVMDRDMLALNFALRHIDPFDLDAREKLVAEYAFAQSGLKIDPKRFAHITQNIELERANTYSPGRGPSENIPGGGFCMVFGQAPDDDGPSQLRELMALNSDYDILGQRLRPGLMPLALYNAYTDYHELGHCLYPFPDANEKMTVAERAFRIHKAEMFGDVLATLLLARDGLPDFGARYAAVRLVTSALGNVGGDYGHATWDGLLAGQREAAARGRAGLKNLSLRQIRDIAERVTAEQAMSWQKMQTAEAFQKSDFDPAALKAAPPAEAAYARNLKKQMNRALSRALDLKGLQPGLTPLEIVRFYRTHPTAVPEVADTAPDAQLAARLTAQMTAALGGKNDTASLVKVLSQQQEALRQGLEAKDEPRRREAVRSLQLLDKVFRQKLVEIEAPKPAKIF